MSSNKQSLEQEPQNAPEPKSDSDKLAESLKKAAKIIVVDDSDFGRKSIVTILEDEGFNVVGQTGRPESLAEVLKKQDANIFILDLVMPGISGLELAKKIRETLRGVAIIMISSLSQDHIIIESLSAGASDFLTKPFSKEDLINAVTKAAKHVKSRE